MELFKIHQVLRYCNFCKVNGVQISVVHIFLRCILLLKNWKCSVSVCWTNTLIFTLFLMSCLKSKDVPLNFRNRSSKQTYRTRKASQLIFLIKRFVLSIKMYEIDVGSKILGDGDGISYPFISSYLGLSRLFMSLHVMNEMFLNIHLSCFVTMYYHIYYVSLFLWRLLSDGKQSVPPMDT